MRRSRFLFALPPLALVLVTGCGGGGGSQASGLSVTLDHSQLSFATLNSSPFGYQTINFTVANAANGTTYYVGAESSLTGIFQANFNLNTTTSGTVTVSPASGFVPTPGQTLTGTLTFLVATNPSGQNPVWTGTLPVTLTEFAIAPSAAALTAVEQGAPVSTQLTVSPADTTGILQATPSNAAWLSVTHGSPGSVTVQATPGTLTPGAYQGLVQLSALGAQLNETATLTLQTELEAPAPQAIPLKAATPTAALAGTFQVEFRDTPAPAWTASSDQPWLVLGAYGSGTLPYTVDPSKLPAMAYGSSATATIQIQAPGYTSVSTQVLLTNLLPRVNRVLPAVVTPGQGGSFHVYGQGFSQFADGAGLSLDGTPVTGTILSDMEAVLQTGTLSAGAHTVSPTLQPGLPATAVSLTAALSPAYTYTVVPSTTTSEGYDTGFFDPVRTVLFALDSGAQQVKSFAWTASGWTMTTASVPGATGIALTPDRTGLLVSANGLLATLDPDTLASTGSFTAPNALPTDQANLPYTEDNLFWFAGSQWTGLTSFDPVSQTVSEVLPDFSFYSPLLFPSTDGSLMIVMQTGIDPQPAPSLYGALNQTFTGLNAALPSYFLGAQFSMDDTRLWVDGLGYYTFATGALLGQAEDGTTLYAQPGCLSADGNRIYRLALDGTLGVQSLDVFDATQVVSGTTHFVKLGSIPLPDQVSGLQTDSSFHNLPGVFLSPVGDAAFVLGNLNLLTVPIPSGLQGSTTGAFALKAMTSKGSSVRMR